jgi:DNA polymerase-3 subunit gamma/tau
MRAGGGSVRDTLSVLDQLMVGSVDGTITYDSASALLGFTPEALISDAIDAVIDKDGSSLYSTIEKVVVGGFEPRRFVEDLLARVRDLLVLTLAGKQAVQVFSDETEGENTDSLARQAKALGLNKLTLIAQKINDTLATMSGATSPRMRLELLAAQLLAAVEEPVWQGQNLGQGQSSAAPQQTAVQNAPAAAPARGGFNPPPRKPAAAAQKAAPQQTEIRQAAPNTESAPRVENSVQTAEHSAQHTAEQTEQKVEHATAQEGVPASDMDLWKTTLAQMPHDLSAYVENSKVPIVEFSTNALGGKHLVFTFDTPLSQHAFALAVTNQNRSVPGLVQNEVRKVFGKTASIAPNTVAANGEAVQTVNSMSPQQRAEVKRSIALSAMKSATTTMQTPAEEHREAKTDSATSDGGDGDSDAHHVASVASAPAESISAAGVAPADVSAADDPWADDEAAPQQQVPQQAEQHEAKATKHVAVPQAGDEEDPWAQPEPAPESEPEREPEQESSTSSEPLSVTPSATMPQASAPRQTLNPMQGGAQQTMSPGGLRQQGQGDQSDRTPKPSVSAEEDTYSMNDESLGASDLVDLETLKKILDVKEVREIAPSDSDK